MDKPYDVFISYSRKDYEDNGSIIPGNPISSILELLERNEISYWFDKEGIYSGSKFIEVINEAIMSSKMLIFISSQNSNASKWTAGEILLACDAEMEVLPVKIDDTSYSPKFNLAIRPLDFVDYYKNEAESLDRILKAVLKIKADFASKQVAAEILGLAKDCQVLLSQQEALVMKLVAMNLSVGKTEKECPVCGKHIPLGDSYCGRCGWRFPVLYALGESHIPAGDKHHLTLSRANWQKVSADAEAAAKAQQLEEENDQLRKKLRKIAEECETFKVDIERWKSDLRSQGKQYEKQMDELTQLKKRQLKELEDTIKRYSDEIALLKLKLSEYEKDNSRLKTRLERVQNDLLEAEGKLKKTEEELKTKSRELDKLKWMVSSSPYRISSQTFTVKGVSFNMIRVVGQGNPFYIGETQVTQELWEAVMGSNPSHFKSKNLPVEMVSWDDCQEFIKRLNSEMGKKFRLPKEAEWVYAAKGGNKSRGYEYSGSNQIDEVAWYDKNAYDVGTKSPYYGTHPVKTKKANELGIYDMSGNVWEWSEDLYRYQGSSRLALGGGWNNNSYRCRVAARDSYSPLNRFFNLGLRLAL